MRLGLGNDELETALLEAFGSRPKDGWQAEKNRAEKHPAHESMATIGG